MSQTIKLTYFDFHGGRGEPARLALHIGGIPFEDERLDFQAFGARKPGLPFGAMPLLEVDGQVVTQSNGINRYVGTLAGLYPSDPWQAALCDEVMGAIEDMSAKILPTMRIQDAAERQAAREALVAGPIPLFLKRLQARLAAQGGRYFVEDRLTVADFKVFVWIRHLKSGQLDHIPADLADVHAPLLAAHFERISKDPGVVAYYAQFG